MHSHKTYSNIKKPLPGYYIPLNANKIYMKLASAPTKRMRCICGDRGFIISFSKLKIVKYILPLSIIFKKR